MPQRVDDPIIADDDWLWRRIRNRPEWYAKNPDQDDGLAQIKAGLPRSLQHIVVADPEPDNPAHTLICPLDALTPGQRKSSARTMAKAAEWLVKPKSLRGE